MRVIENRCRGCASPSYPCRAPYCSFYKYEAFYCDKCGEEIVEPIDGKDYCDDCFDEIMGGEE